MSYLRYFYFILYGIFILIYFIRTSDLFRRPKQTSNKTGKTRKTRKGGNDNGNDGNECGKNTQQPTNRKENNKTKRRDEQEKVKEQ